MKAFKLSAAAALALALAGCGGSDMAGGNNAAAGAEQNFKVEQIAAPNGANWADTVTQTPDGGFLRGNPTAKVKVVEYGSMTCSHCADFSEKGEPALIDKYVKSGQVSFEFRNFVRDPADMAAALIARCNGATAFFPLTEQLFASQAEWMAKLQEMPADQQAQLQTMTPAQAVGVYAQAAGLVDFARVRGIPAAKAQACVADAAQVQKLVEIGQKAGQIPGTPAFMINGTLVPNSADWKTLEPAIQQALR
ncbi:MAG TPA: thioredoxin domain-containing protein [Allosphingosinicella sp.]|jgi:protein-disulfide isomerase